MAIIPLTNEDWGFETNCFVCEPSNPRGLQIPFFHDQERSVVFADFTLGDHCSSAPTFVHGGLSLAILDEAMAWASIALGGQWGVTVETTSTFHAPVNVGREYRVEARLGSQSAESLHLTAEILGGTSVRVAASARFAPMGEAVAVAATGGEVSLENRRFLRAPATRPGSSSADD